MNQRSRPRLPCQVIGWSRPTDGQGDVHDDGTLADYSQRFRRTLHRDEPIDRSVMPGPTLDDILACPTLPSMPAVAIEVLELMRQPNVQVTDLERVIQNDPALATRILKVANSSYYGLTDPCATISRALAYLGLGVVKSIVLGFSLVDLTRRSEGELDLLEYWQRCLFSAAAARRIARDAGEEDPEVAFVTALMQDIGMLALDSTLGTDYAAVASDGDHLRLAKREKAAFGFDHAEVGAELATSWRLPDELVEPIRMHHAETVPDKCTNVTRIVCFASRVSLAIIRGARGASEWRKLEQAGRDLVGLTGSDLRALLAAVDQDTNKLARLFQADLGETPSAGAILAEAEEARFAHQIDTQLEAVKLQQKNEALSKQAYTDGLTGVANRKRFDDALAEAFEETGRSGGSLGLFLTDADKFKSLNDTLGHEAGDLVLQAIAQRLEAAIGDRGLVCRYGGEEFAVLMRDADRATVARAAEEARQAIEASPIDLASPRISTKEVSVTASFGASTYEPATAAVITTPELLLRSADKALYAAKTAGRNCVRVFRPRTAARAA